MFDNSKEASVAGMEWTRCQGGNGVRVGGAGLVCRVFEEWYILEQKFSASRMKNTPATQPQNREDSLGYHSGGTLFNAAQPSPFSRSPGSGLQGIPVLSLHF